MTNKNYTRISADYVQTKHAFEDSMRRLKQELNVAATALYIATPKQQPLESDRLKTAMDQHFSAFMKYAKSYYAYYKGGRGATRELIGKSLNVAARAQALGQTQAERDLMAFVKKLMIERCQNALSAYQKKPTQDSTKTLLISVADAMALGIEEQPGCRKANEEVQRLASEGI